MKNAKGFSLTEIMVGGAILAGVGLSGAIMFKDQRKAQKAIELDQRLVNFHQSLIDTLSKTQNCNATLKHFYDSGITAVVPPTPSLRLRTCTAGCDVSDLKSDASAVTRSTPVFAPGSFIDNSNTWMLEYVAIPIPATITMTGSLMLEVTYRMNPELGNKSVIKHILLNTRFSGGLFKECYDRQESAVNNLQNDICNSMEAISTGGASTSVLARWDDETQSCVFTAQKTCEDPATSIDGISSDGSIHCDSSTKNIKPMDFFNPAATANCSLTEKPVLKWNNVTKKFRIICI